jgi:hypothetical protein
VPERAQSAIPLGPSRSRRVAGPLTPALLVTLLSSRHLHRSRRLPDLIWAHALLGNTCSSLECRRMAVRQTGALGARKRRCTGRPGRVLGQWMDRMDPRREEWCCEHSMPCPSHPARDTVFLAVVSCTIHYASIAHSLSASPLHYNSRHRRSRSFTTLFIAMWGTLALATLSLAAPALAQGATCNQTQACPLSAPCCSPYGFCGKEQFCLGGCEPLCEATLGCADQTRTSSRRASPSPYAATS